MTESLRNTALASAVVLIGGVLLICVAFGVGAFTDPAETSALTRRAVIVIAPVLLLAGLFGLTRALAGAGQRVDPATMGVIGFTAVALLGTGIAAYLGTREGTQRLEDQSLPYSFSYPESWHQDPGPDLPLIALSNAVGVSSDSDARVVNGVLVGTFSHVGSAPYEQAMMDTFGRAGQRVVERTETQVAGRPAVRFDVDSPAGYDSVLTLVFDGTMGYWIQCVWATERDVTMKACDQVLKSFTIR